MINEPAQRLIAALEGDQYEQITGSDRRGNCFCVRGVAVDIYLKDHGLEWQKKSGNYWDYPDNLKCNEIWKYFGLNHTHGYFLVTANDAGASFKELAEKIKRYLTYKENS